MVYISLFLFIFFESLFKKYKNKGFYGVKFLRKLMDINYHDGSRSPKDFSPRCTTEKFY